MFSRHSASHSGFDQIYKTDYGEDRGLLSTTKHIQGNPQQNRNPLQKRNVIQTLRPERGQRHMLLVSVHSVSKKLVRLVIRRRQLNHS